MAHFSEIEPEARSSDQIREYYQDRPRGGVYGRVAKRVFDIAVVLACAPFAMGLIGIFALMVRRDGGPAFYSQDRIGRNGRVFRFWKLRSMVVDAEERLGGLLARDPAARAEWDKHQKLRDDPRITPLGAWLRKSSFDELPQLWNVLKGDMSLVGPRPMMPAQRRLYPGRAYFELRPGVTGFWQISERNDTSFASRARYDAQYAARMSLLTDLTVLLLTLRVVFRGTGY